VVLFSVIEHHFSWADNAISPVERRQRQAELDALCKELSAEAFATAWGEGQAFTMDQALAFALGEYL
jgi:hypothetical protein